VAIRLAIRLVLATCLFGAMTASAEIRVAGVIAHLIPTQLFEYTPRGLPVSSNGFIVLLGGVSAFGTAFLPEESFDNNHYTVMYLCTSGCPYGMPTLSRPLREGDLLYFGVNPTVGVSVILGRPTTAGVIDTVSDYPWSFAGSSTDTVPLFFNDRNDLFGVKTQNTFSKMVEVHLLTRVSAYQSYAAHLATALPLSEAPNFTFRVNQMGDLIAIKTANAGSGAIEVHRLSLASGYRSFSLQAPIPIALSEASKFKFLIAPNGDLYAIKVLGTGTGTVELHILSAVSNYQTFITEVGIPLGLSSVPNFDFAIAPNGDLQLIAKSHTGSGTVEVHSLSKQSYFQAFSLHTGTELSQVDGPNCQFRVTAEGDLACLKISNTGSHSVEVHSLSAADYQRFTLHTATAFYLAPN